MSRSRRGFTLVELMIAMVMGLIIALAAVALARTATHTFFEQARISGVEANVRAASERFRNDLSRVAFMSASNVRSDPGQARRPGVLGEQYRVVALRDLQGLKVEPAANTAVNSTTNKLAPQDVTISGNLTSNDVYRGQLLATGVGCGGADGARVRLSGRSDAAVRRMFKGTTSAADIKAMTQLVFTPGERMAPQVTGVDYVVQVTDMRGCVNYLTVCAVDEAVSETDAVLLHLKGDGTRGILTPADTMGGVCGARVMEEVAIAPVQRVKWYLDVDSDVRRIDTEREGPSASPSERRKLNLYRQLLAADGVTAVGAPEIVAEYAVDLQLGLLVDSSISLASPATTNIDFDKPYTDFEPWVQPVSKADLSQVKLQGPQRIRSVRYRLAFRTPTADRKADLPMYGGAPYISRYCMGGGSPCTEWARVRTIISEVALLNQVKATY